MIVKTTVEGVFIDLVRSILNNNGKPSALPEGISADDVFATGCIQDMVPITFCALNSISPKPESEKWGEWRRQFMDDCMRSEIQMSEYRRLVEYLCGRGVRIIPLKGCVVKELYPAPELRVMCDVDLLYEGVDSKKLSELMEAFGYSTENLGDGCHDVFIKKPSMRIELHRTLLKGDSPYRAALQDVFGRAEEDGEISNLYHLKPEDLYIHMLVHAAKHFRESGLGVRPLADIYIVNQKYAGSWDAGYISDRLGAVGLERFEAKMKEIAYAFFGEEEKELPEAEMMYFFRGSTYGDSANAKEWECNSLKFRTKAGLVFYKTFLPYEIMKGRYPVLEKYPVLLPFLWVYRWFVLLKKYRPEVRAVLAADTSGDKQKEVMSVYSEFGLDE